jgi:integrase
MSLCKRRNVWWIRITHNGQRVQQSTGTSDKVAAQQLHDNVKADLWKKDKLQEKPQCTWMDAVVRWVEESQHKRSLEDDKAHLRWIGSHLKKFMLNQITRDMIDKAANLKLREGVKPATVNRMLEVVRAILRKAEREWDWLDKAPIIRMLKEDNRRIRWITQNDATKLLKELPPHLAAMAAFSLATGLRQSNVSKLEWRDVDLVKCHAWVHPDQAKAEKAIPVPLIGTRDAYQRKSGKYGAAKLLISPQKFGAPGEIRTPDHLVRSQVLYPAELRVRFVGGERGIRTLDGVLSPILP